MNRKPQPVLDINLRSFVTSRNRGERLYSKRGGLRSIRVLMRFTALLAVLVAGIAAWSGHSNAFPQKQSAAFNDNSCVSCHSGLVKPPEMGTAYLEWHISIHRTAGVACNECHGGDPKAQDAKNAHGGILPPANRQSRVNPLNLPETCGSCHKAVVSSFVESTHYRRLKESGLGPSCTSCHRHMASAVARYPSEGAAYCTYCHNAINGLQPQRPDIPKKAKTVLEALGRANYMSTWVNDLLKEAQQKKLSVTVEEEDIRLLKMLLQEAKAGWHSFNFEGAETKANKAYEEGLDIKERLSRKLGLK